MLKDILVLILVGCCVPVFSQEHSDAYKLWEASLGLEKTRQIMQAVAKFDTSLEIYPTPIINNRGELQSFMFLDNSNKVFFYLQEKNAPVISQSVDVYSYTDVNLLDHQLRDAGVLRKYAAVYDFSTARLIRLEEPGGKLAASYFLEISNVQINDKNALLYDFGNDIFTYESDGVINQDYSMVEYNWNKGLRCDVYLISVADGSKKMLQRNVDISYYGFPFFRFSPDGHYILSFENHNYYAYNISSGVNTCISKGISHNFIRSETPRDFYNPHYNIISWKDSIAVQVRDAHSNVWQLNLSTAGGAPTKIIIPKNQVPITKSNFKEGNIVTEEITWKTFDGKMGTGVLAKPKNFDPRKKYPIIFNYYENSVIKHNDNKLYGVGDFVDYDYLVFSPTIRYAIGSTGASVFNYVVSAAKYFQQLPYVDAKRMGLRGASFGGFETNYLVTHSKLFAAAISMAGLSDLIANIGAQDIWKKPHQLDGTDQVRLGATLWQRPDIWIKNSPIFYADRVTTPLLLIHSKSDGAVPFEQSLAFFRALRSMGKRSWLLQYDDVGHIGLTSSIVGKTDGNCDFCIRQLQFFNHYLKNAPAPQWMLDNIPARLKGTRKGLELDSSNTAPGAGLRRDKLVLTSQQEELLKHRTMVTEDGRIVDKIENKK